MNYFKITGFENGDPIEPYGVETYSPAYKGKRKDSFWHKDFDAEAKK